jgi:hypothetical protein
MKQLIKNKPLKISLIIIEILLVMFQSLVIMLDLKKEYYLIYDWIFFVVNYLIIFIFIMLISKNKIIKWFQIGIALALVSINTVFFCYLGATKTIISKSPNRENEIVIREYPNQNYESIKLRPKWVLFGKKVEVLKNSSNYKALTENKYKIEWTDNDAVIFTYQMNKDGILEQGFYNFREQQISYKNVLPSLYGKWVSEKDPKNYFVVDLKDVIYAKSGQVYYYENAEIDQRGEIGLVFNSISGDKPSFSLILNSDSVIGQDCLVNQNGSITISDISLTNSNGEIFRKQ